VSVVPIGFYGQDYDDDGNQVPEPGARVVRLADVTPERVRWLWPGRLPLGKLVVLDGDPGVGKSALTLDWAARVSTGSPWPDRAPCPQGDVLLLSAEDGLADTIRPRLDAAGADPARVHALTEVVTLGDQGQALARPPVIPADLHLAEDVISGHGVRLALIDVLMAYLSGEVNSNKDQDVRRALHAMASMADRTGCCIVAVRHLNKTSGASAMYRGGGSIGIIGAARSALIAAADPDDEEGRRRILAPVKVNIAAMPPALAYQLVPDDLHGCARVQWLGGSDQTASGLLGDPAAAEERTERDEAAEWLTGWLTDRDGESTAAEAFRAARADGISERTLKRARARAGVTSQRQGFAGGSVWRLSPSGPHSGHSGHAPEPGPDGPDGGPNDGGGLFTARASGKRNDPA